jgi:hypothetical protein
MDDCAAFQTLASIQAQVSRRSIEYCRDFGNFPPRFIVMHSKSPFLGTVWRPTLLLGLEIDCHCRKCPPQHERRFAGHPALGTARALLETATIAPKTKGSRKNAMQD